MVPFVRPGMVLIAALTASAGAHAQDRTQERSEDEEIVVTAERQRGGVPFDIQPETTYSAADVRSYGASSIFQILSAISPQTGSASIRGGGFPIVLVNGRRISGFQEIRDLPPDVISKVEVFDEQLALQYGFSPDQRVVNLILEQRFAADFVEAGGGGADDDARATLRAEGGRAVIDEGTRLALSAAIDTATSITELERGIAAPSVGVDARSARTLAPQTEAWRANASYARALSERVTGNLALRLEQSDQHSLLGLDAFGALRERDAQSELARLSAGLDGALGGWQWTATATGDLTSQDSTTRDSVARTRTGSDQALIDLTANANGAVFDLPGGRVRASFRAGAEHRQIDSLADDGAVETRTELDRTTPSARATLLTPLTSRRREFGQAFGDLSLNTTASWSEPSDFTALTSFGYGGSWSPTRSLRFSLQSEHSEAAPSLQQLGDPALATPDVPFFDAATGQTVAITRTTGGNTALGAEEREDLTFNASWSFGQALTLAFSWARNDTTGVVTALPTALAEAEAAFPARYTRDLGGTLLAVDARPVNIARRDIESIRWGVSYSRSLGGAPRRDRDYR